MMMTMVMIKCGFLLHWTISKVLEHAISLTSIDVA
jgi:hypothetical protein